MLGWQNLLFLVPLGLALAYLFAYSLSGWTFGEADVDVEAELDANVELDLDADAEVVAAKPDIDADSDVDNAHGILTQLTWLGVGRVPLSIVLMVLFLTFGLVGFATMQLLRDSLGTNGIWVALPTAAIVSFGLTSLVSQLIARYMPLNESSAESRSSYVGKRGTVVFTVSPTGGTITIRDSGGDLYQLPARCRQGTIAPGTEVILTNYTNGLFHVRPSGF